MDRDIRHKIAPGSTDGDSSRKGTWAIRVHAFEGLTQGCDTRRTASSPTVPHLQTHTQFTNERRQLLETPLPKGSVEEISREEYRELLTGEFEPPNLRAGLCTVENVVDSRSSVMSGTSPGRKRKTYKDNSTLAAPGKKLKLSPSSSVQEIPDPARSQSSNNDEGLITTCKRVKPNPSESEKQDISEIRRGAHYTSLKAGSTNGCLQETSSLISKAASWFSEFLNGPSRSFREFGDPNDEEAVPIALPDNTNMKVGKPFRPHNRLNDPTPGQPAKKTFDLQNSVFVADQEHHEAKRRKLSPEHLTRRVSSNSALDFYTNASTSSHSPGGSGTLKSVQSYNPNNHDTFGKVKEFTSVEEMMRVGKPSSKKGQYNRINNTQSAQKKRPLVSKSETDSPKAVAPGHAIILDEDDDIEEVSPEPSRYQGNANLKPSRLKIHRQLRGIGVDERTSIPVLNSGDRVKLEAGNKTLTSTSQRNTRALFGDFQRRRKSSSSFGYDEEDSADQLAEGHDSGQVGRTGLGSKAPVKDTIPILRSAFDSVSRKGDIPRSSLAKVSHKSQKSPSDSFFPVKYICAESWRWPVQGAVSEYWEYRLNPQSGDMEPFCNEESQANNLPGLVVKPHKLHKVTYSEESPKILLQRPLETRPGSSAKLFLELCEGYESGRFVQTLQHFNTKFKLEVHESSARLDKMQDKMQDRMQEQDDREAAKVAKIAQSGKSDVDLMKSNQSRRQLESCRGHGPQQFTRQSIKRDQRILEDNDRRQNSDLTEPQSRESLVNNMKVKEHSPTQDLPRTRLSSQSKPDHALSRDSALSDDKPATRSSARNQPAQRLRTPSPVRWTKQNPGWKTEKSWVSSLVYPPEGKKKAIVDLEDIPRLDEGEFLNDNLIAFYVRVLEYQLEKQHPDLAKRIYFQNTFFYEALTKGKVRSNNINYDAVKRWTAKVDLFTYDYIVVPVNEKLHWYLAIICNAPKLIQPNTTDSHESHVVTGAENPSENGTSAQEDGKVPKIHGKSHIAGSLRTASSSESMNQKVEHMSLEEKSGYGEEHPQERVDQDEEWPESDRPLEMTLQLNALRSIHKETVRPSEETLSSVDQPNESALTPKGKKSKRKSGPLRKYDLGDARIITLDSLGLTHSPACSNLREYLVCEAKDKRGIDISAERLGMTAKNIPQQNNYCDCGVYVLSYIERFLDDPDTFIRLILRGEMDVKRDWPVMDASIMRDKVRTLLFDKQAEQIEREKEQRKSRKANKATKSALKSDESETSLDKNVGTLQIQKSQRHPISPSAKLPISPAHAKSIAETPPPGFIDDIVEMSARRGQSSAKRRQTSTSLLTPSDPFKGPTPRTSVILPPTRGSSKTGIFKQFAKKNDGLQESTISSPPQIGATQDTPVEIDDGIEQDQLPQMIGSTEYRGREESFEDIMELTIPGNAKSSNPRPNTPTNSVAVATRSSPRGLKNQAMSTDTVYMSRSERTKAGLWTRRKSQASA